MHQGIELLSTKESYLVIKTINKKLGHFVNKTTNYIYVSLAF